MKGPARLERVVLCREDSLPRAWHHSVQKGGPETHHTPGSLPPRGCSHVLWHGSHERGPAWKLFFFFFLLSLSFRVLFWGQKLFPKPR